MHHTHVGGDAGGGVGQRVQGQRLAGQGFDGAGARRVVDASMGGHTLHLKLHQH